MPDWTEWLSEEERARLRIYERVLESEFRDGIGFLKYDVMPLFHSLAASRALVAEKDKALRAAHDLWSYLPFDSGADIDETARHTRKQQNAALALTEADMLERLEVK